MLRTGRVALSFFGDGAVNQGAFLECGNLAALWKLPLILVCENNGYAMSATPARTTAVADLTARGVGMGIPSANVDGMDAVAVHGAVAEAVARARSGGGPTLIVARCYRLMGHFSGDSQKYRSREEVREWWEKDPIERLKERLIAGGELTADAVAELVAEAKAVVQVALDRAKAAPLPDPAEVGNFVYA